MKLVIGFILTALVSGNAWSGRPCFTAIKALVVESNTAKTQKINRADLIF
jgi:hypothetical protein